MPYQRTSLFLTANLASEINRFVSAFEKTDYDLISGAYGRACKIIDELETFPDMKQRKQELSILREVLKDMIDKKGKTRVTPKFLKEYFMPFAIRLMSKT